MRALSVDLRERIVSAYENNEGSHSSLATRFSVSRAVVGKLVRQQRELGTLQPQVHLRGRKPAIEGVKLEQLRQHLVDYPDATLAERIEALDLDCCVNTMWATIRRLGCRYKKSLHAQPLDVRLQEAAASSLTHREFLELILQDDMLVRGDRQIQRRTTQATFRDQRRLEDFDFSFNTSIKKQKIFELATCQFVHHHRDLLLVGPPGTGKSHLVQALGHAAIRQVLQVYYRSIFDIVRDFLHDEALDGYEKILNRYLKIGLANHR